MHITGCTIHKRESHSVQCVFEGPPRKTMVIVLKNILEIFVHVHARSPGRPGLSCPSPSPLPRPPSRSPPRSLFFGFGGRPTCTTLGLALGVGRGARRAFCGFFGSRRTCMRRIVHCEGPAIRHTASLMVVCIPGRFAFSARGAILGHSCVF